MPWECNWIINDFLFIYARKLIFSIQLNCAMEATTSFLFIDKWIDYVFNAIKLFYKLVSDEKKQFFSLEENILHF